MNAILGFIIEKVIKVIIEKFVEYMNLKKEELDAKKRANEKIKEIKKDEDRQNRAKRMRDFLSY